MTMSGDNVDGDGLPLIDHETFAKWRAEALENQPSPKDWADLVALLRWENELDRRGVEMTDVPKGFTAAARSLKTLLLFLQNHRVLMQDGAIAPLMRLNAGMIDVASGTASPLFQPATKRAGPPAKGVTMDIIQAFAARAMSELMEAGNSRDEAAVENRQRASQGTPRGHGQSRSKNGKTLAQSNSGR